MFSILSWLHIGAAVAVVGGVVFGLFVLRPSLAGLEPPVIGKLMGGVAARFRWIVWGSIAVFIVTGLWMATTYRDINSGADLTATSYGRTLLGKSILSLLLFASALAITLPWKNLAWAKRPTRLLFFQRLNVVLAAIIILLAALMVRNGGIF